MMNEPTIDDVRAFEGIIQERVSQGFLRDQTRNRFHPIDPETGLPSLPEGYFWRVARSIGKREEVRLIFRKETTENVVTFSTLFTGKTKPVKTTVTRQIESFPVSAAYTDPVVGIFEATCSLLTYMAGRITNEVRGPGMQAYYGDYPPKNVTKVEDE